MSREIKYYVIHNFNNERRDRVCRVLLYNGVNPKDVKWVLKPNIQDLSRGFYDNISTKVKHIKPGYICVSYKHYMCLKDIVENENEYSVIIEDNINDVININIPDRLNKYLDEVPEDWDALFDTQWKSYSVVDEEKVVPSKLVYKKNNAWHPNSSGSTRLAQFYILSKKGANKLYENYLPLGGPPDHWMDELFRKLDMNIYWSEPSFIKYEDNHKTSTDMRLSEKWNEPFTNIENYNKKNSLMLNMEEFLKK